MLFIHKIILLFCLLFHSSLGMHPDDAAILKIFYDSLTSKGSLVWNFDGDLCMQGGAGVACDYNDRLMWLDISSKGVRGTLPTEFGLLTTLTNINFQSNYLTGTIPTELAQNKNHLLHVFLRWNQFTGPIPENLAPGIKTTLFLEDNYWDCPVLDYSRAAIDDYPDARDQCNTSCQPDTCESGWICSRRPDGGHNCACPPGYYGDHCEIAVNCSSIANEGNAEWDQTLAIGEKVNGKCLDGFQGSVTRRCIQSGANGNWGLISGFCNDTDECLNNNGGCGSLKVCKNTIGNFTCLCPSDYYGKGDSQCFSCPQNSTSEEGSETIFGCKCDSPNHYPNSKASTCTPCPSGFLLDNNSNTCQALPTNPSPTPTSNANNQRNQQIGIRLSLSLFLLVSFLFI